MQLFQDANGHSVIMLGITQLELKVGTWLWCQWEPDELHVGGGGADRSNTKKGNFHFSLVLGGHRRAAVTASANERQQQQHRTTATSHEDDEALWGLYGRLILEKMVAKSSLASPTKLLLGISLQQPSSTTLQEKTETLHAIVDALVQLYSDLMVASS